jgi:hypothetical protein
MILNSELERIWKYRQVSFYARVMFLKKSRKSKLQRMNTKFPFKTVHFLGVRGLTTSSNIV